MTNTKPTWEELKKELLEKAKMFEYIGKNQDCNICGIDPSKLVKYIDDIIQEVHDEAYERGYEDGKSEVEDDIRYNYDIKELV